MRTTEFVLESSELMVLGRLYDGWRREQFDEAASEGLVGLIENACLLTQRVRLHRRSTSGRSWTTYRNWSVDRTTFPRSEALKQEGRSGATNCVDRYDPGTRDARHFGVVRLAGRLARRGVANDFRHSHRLCEHAMDVAADA